ncbi:MAG: hypothetical protein JNL08_06875 [Planctomycetes bacterium]|nr:hypothetical protein [Planctomycetota bacterium]
MTDSRDSKGVLRRDRVRLQAQPAQIDCGTDAAGRPTGTLVVVPLLDGDRVAGFEVRCGCGASAVVECVYGPAAATPLQHHEETPA